MPGPNPVWYLDWQFWTAVIALLALALSQIPPLYIVFRRAHLDVEPYQKINLTHKVGNPNCHLHLVLVNDGGRTIRVRGIELTFRRGNDAPFTLRAFSYDPMAGREYGLLLTPFSLTPRQEWSHLVIFLLPFSREEERRWRQLESAVRTNVTGKYAERPGQAGLQEADAEVLQPVLQQFRDKFRWEPGEYEVLLTLHTVPHRATTQKRYRLTLFESDAEQLRSYANEYKYGLGVYYSDAKRMPGVWVPVSEI